MRFDRWHRRLCASPALRIVLVMIAWLGLISALHLHFNFTSETRPVVKMGYMPVITNLAAPILDHVSDRSGPVRFQAVKFASFAEMAEALRNEQIQAAFMIAPLAIVLHQQGEAVNIVYIGNRHESTLVVRKDLKVSGLSDLAGRTIAVPMRYSGHCLGLLQLMRSRGLQRRIQIVEMNPPDMAAALAVGALDGYFVGEPFAALSVKTGRAEVLCYVEDLWPQFICNLVLVKRAFIDSAPDQVRMLVQAAARSGLWARQHPAEAAQIAAQYWKQPLDLVTYALTRPPDRILYDRFLPRRDEIQHIADLMHRHGLASHSDTTGLVEDRFAREVNLEGIDNLASILDPAAADLWSATSEPRIPNRAPPSPYGRVLAAPQKPMPANSIPKMRRVLSHK
jgi:NitT/TauT family transport system substrate-binding protein